MDDLIARIRDLANSRGCFRGGDIHILVPQADIAEAAAALEAAQAELAEARARASMADGLRSLAGLGIDGHVAAVQTAKDMAGRLVKAEAERDRLAALLKEAVEGLREIEKADTTQMGTGSYVPGKVSVLTSHDVPGPFAIRARALITKLEERG